MAYTPKTWVDNVDLVSAAELNRIETGVDQAHDLAEAKEIFVGTTAPADTTKIWVDTN